MGADGTQGYLTVAARSTMYAEMAVDLALSLRAVDPGRPVSIVVDGRLRPLVEERYRGPFDQVLELPAAYEFARARKFCVAELTPYDASLFLDADSLALRSLDPLWRGLAGSGFAMMGTMLPADHEAVHHGEAVAVLCRRYGLDRYFKSNSSVFYFTREQGRRVLRACLEAYRDEVRPGRGWAGDEIAFAIVGSRQGIDEMPRPWPVLWPEALATLDLDSDDVPLFTALGAPPAHTMDRLMEAVAARREAAGITQGSERYWRFKMGWSNATRVRDALFPLRRRLLDLRHALSGTR